MAAVAAKVLKIQVLYAPKVLSPALGDFVGVVEKADTGVLTTSADFPKMDELNCNVAPKAGTACRN